MFLALIPCFERPAAARITKSSTVGAKFERARIESPDAPNVNKNVVMISYESPLPLPSLYSLLSNVLIFRCLLLEALLLHSTGTVGPRDGELPVACSVYFNHVEVSIDGKLIALPIPIWLPLIAGLLCGGRLVRA